MWKVWTIRHCLETGIIDSQSVRYVNPDTGEVRIGVYPSETFAVGEWFLTEYEAVNAAKELRSQAISKLRTESQCEISRLLELHFSVKTEASAPDEQLPEAVPAEPLETADL